jgi:hypothetical protein
MEKIIARLLAAANTQTGLGNFTAVFELLAQAEMAARDLGDHALASDLFNLYVDAKVKAYG